VHQHPTSGFHSPMLAIDIQSDVSNYKEEQALCYQPSRFYNLFYDPMGEYMGLHFLHVLNPPNFILPSSLGGELKNVINLLSQFDYPFFISDIVNSFQLGGYLNGFGGSLLSPSKLQKLVNVGLYINKIHLEHVCLLYFQVDSVHINLFSSAKCI